MKIEHLAIAVRDPDVSKTFYLETVGLEATATETEWGCELHFPDGFMLALLRDEPVPRAVIERVHFGSGLADRDAVRGTRERLRRAGVSEVEWCDEPDFVSVKVADPDGYVIELYWE